MYNLTAEDLKESSHEIIINITRRREVPVVGCQYGMDYDRTWYRNTAPSDANWVCDKELYVTNSFAFGRVGDVLGTLIMGQLGDIIGRKPVFLLSLAVVVIGRSVAVFCIEIFPVFALLSLLANSCANAVFQSPLAIGMEVSSSSLHARINGVQYIGWTLGISVLPFIAWMCGDWRLLILLTTLPSGLFLLLHRIVPESPRWLAAKDRPEEARKVLKSIAKVNKRELPADCMEKLRHIAEVSRKQKCYGMISLFSSKRLAIRTMLLMVCWIVTSVSYDVIIINVSTLSGNPYLNFFYQSVVELPGYVLGMWITEKLGRRWMHVAFLSLKAIFCFCVITLMSYYEENWWSIVLVMFAKLCVSLNFYIIYLQSLEVYPTCLRQTGTSAGLIMASIFGVIAPFIVYMGVTIDKRYPFATIAGLGIIGAVTASFLPETLDQQLPETLEEAKAFGKDQKYWSIVTKFGESAAKTNGVELEEFPSKRESNQHIIS
ncbi:organic cation transporter protein-like isoform X2 [Ischnura elegans]|nr:organic cation transporter protein-like isoform X2 [Ischnura elegans]